MAGDKHDVEDRLMKLQVRYHGLYNENFSECAEWVNTLARRLHVCADMAGDKHDVEDRLMKLQVRYHGDITRISPSVPSG